MGWGVTACGAGVAGLRSLWPDKPEGVNHVAQQQAGLTCLNRMPIVGCRLAVRVVVSKRRGRAASHARVAAAAGLQQMGRVSSRARAMCHIQVHQEMPAGRVGVPALCACAGGGAGAPAAPCWL